MKCRDVVTEGVGVVVECNVTSAGAIDESVEHFWRMREIDFDVGANERHGCGEDTVEH